MATQLSSYIVISQKSAPELESHLNHYAQFGYVMQGGIVFKGGDLIVAMELQEIDEDVETRVEEDMASRAERIRIEAQREADEKIAALSQGGPVPPPPPISQGAPPPMASLRAPSQPGAVPPPPNLGPMVPAPRHPSQNEVDRPENKSGSGPHVLQALESLRR